MGANECELKDDLIYKDEVYAIIGAAMEVSNELGRSTSLILLVTEK